MAPGEASAIPPPLLPAHPSLGNYRELFVSRGLERYLANSVFLATAATLASLVFNVAAGYAFAKLRFPGRDRIFRVLLGALVIPGQVAMVPLFLLLKQLGLVNSYGGVLVPALASIFGIFLVRQYALSIPGRIARSGTDRRRQRIPNLPLDRAPGAQAHHRDAGGVHAARNLERLHVAADRACRQGALHAAGGARHPGARARAGQRADDGGVGGHDRCRCCSSSSRCSAITCRACWPAA